MSFGEDIRLPRSGQHALNLPRVRGSTLLWVACAISSAGYILLFVTLHLRSVGWAPGQVLEPFTAYWQIFYRLIFSEERVMASRRSGVAALHPLLMVAAFALSGIGFLLTIHALRTAHARQRPRLRTLLGLTVLHSAPLLALPNLLSGDIYSYISFGRIAVLYGGNPFIEPPSVFFRDRYFQWVNWSHVPSVYGPAWIYLSMALTLLVETIYSSIISYVLAYKLLALGLHLLNGVLIWSVLGKWKPEQREWGTAFYLLNPLTLIEFAGNAHNDVLMIGFILLSILLHLQRRWIWATAALTFAVLCKWIALPLLPLYALLLMRGAARWRGRLTYAFGMLAVFITLTVGLYAPYWEGPKTLQVLIEAPPQKRLINSIGDMLVHEGQYVMYLLGRWPNPAWGEFAPLTMQTSRDRGVEAIDGQTWRNAQRTRLQRYNRQQIAMRLEVQAHERILANIARTAGLIIVALACLAAAAVTRSLHVYLLAATWIFFVYVAIGAVWVWPWYATWIVALAALLDWRVTGRAALLLSLLILLTYPLFPSLPEPQLFQRMRGLLTFGPPLAFSGYHLAALARKRWRRERSGISRQPSAVSRQ